MPISESSIKKFLKHLVDAHYSGTTTEFNEFLQSRSVKALLNERIAVLENISDLTQLGKLQITITQLVIPSSEEK